MSTPQTFIDAGELDALKKPLGERLWSLARKQPLGTAGALVVIVMAFAAAFADFLTPFDPVVNSLEDMLTPRTPSSPWAPTSSAATS